MQILVKNVINEVFWLIVIVSEKSLYVIKHIDLWLRGSTIILLFISNHLYIGTVQNYFKLFKRRCH